MTNVERMLSLYLDCIGITGYAIKASQDTLGFLIVMVIPRENKKKIGILKGKNGRNLNLLKQLLRIIGVLEGINPYLVVQLKSEDGE